MPVLKASWLATYLPVSVRATLDNWAQTYEHHEACKEQHETRKHEVEAGRAAKLSPAMRKTTSCEAQPRDEEDREEAEGAAAATREK